MAKGKSSKRNFDVDKEGIKKIKKAIKALDPHSKNVIRETAEDMVRYAHDEFIEGEMNDAAELYDLAAWTFGIGGIKYFREKRKYSGMAKDIRNYRTKESGLVSREMIALSLLGLFIFTAFYLPNITGNVVGPTKTSLFPLFLALLYIGIASFLLLKRCKQRNNKHIKF